MTMIGTLVYRETILGNSMNNEVTLTGPQADICRTVLCQSLMKTCQLLGEDKDGSGYKLHAKGRYDLTRFSMELQMTLLALGMTSEELAKIVEDFSKA
jgi:hypothetical protein